MCSLVSRYEEQWKKEGLPRAGPFSAELRRRESKLWRWVVDIWEAISTARKVDLALVWTSDALLNADHYYKLMFGVSRNAIGRVYRPEFHFY